MVRYSRRAELDLDAIAEYTKSTWGEVQADIYLEQIERRCLWLAEHPLMGRQYGHPHLTWRRMEQGSHVIFYRERPGGILVQRILHKSMCPDRHLI